MADNTCDIEDHLIHCLLDLLPHDVFIQILACLPVASLLRFKSVCKSWRALIESSFFIHLHATTTTLPSSSKFGTFIFQTSQSYSHTTTENEIFMLSSRSGGWDDDDDYYRKDDEVFEMKSLGFPPLYKVVTRRETQENILMVGSCNGLICLHDSTLRDVSLWNPATSQFRLLPKSLTFEEGIGYLDEDFVAFGFDVKTKDYKVVQITWFTPYMCHHYFPMDKYAFRVQVYSLSTDSWRLLEGINSLPALPVQEPYMNHGLYLNGSYFFMGMDNVFEDPGWLILSFDFTKEIFDTMQLPDHDNCTGWNLSCLGEKMALFESRYDDHYDIWVLNEDVVKESWTKLHSIRKNSSNHKLRGISNNGEFAFIETKGEQHRWWSDFGLTETKGYVAGYGAWNSWKLELFNLVTKEAKYDYLTVGKRMGRADVYKQSLVSIVGGNGASAADRVIGGAI